MDILDGLRAVARRWYVLIPVLALTAYLAFSTYTDVKPEYTGSVIIGVTTSSVVTQAPVPSGSPTVSTTNALIGNGGTGLIVNLLTLGLSQPDVANEVAAAGGTTRYSAAVYERPQSQGQLPILTITAVGATSAQVTTTLTALQQTSDQVLVNVQTNAGVPTEELAKAFVVQAPTEPVRSVPSAVRSTATVVIVGLLVAVALAAVVDAIVVRRRRPPRRPPVSHAAVGTDSSPDPEQWSVETLSNGLATPERTAAVGTTVDDHPTDTVMAYPGPEGDSVRLRRLGRHIARERPPVA